MEPLIEAINNQWAKKNEFVLLISTRMLVLICTKIIRVYNLDNNYSKLNNSELNFNLIKFKAMKDKYIHEFSNF